MLTEFRKQKLQYIYKNVDYDKNNLLTFSDHQQHTIEFVSVLLSKIPTSDVEHKDLIIGKFLAQSVNFWSKIMESQNLHKNSSVSEEQFLEALTKIMSNSSFLSSYLWNLIELIWYTLNLKKTDIISYEDFIHISFKENTQETVKIFSLIDMEKKGGLYIYELYNYWLNFFYSNNQLCPSKYIFGKTNYGGVSLWKTKKSLG